MRRKTLASLVLLMLVPLLMLASVFLQTDQAEIALAQQQVKLAGARNDPQEGVRAIRHLLELQPWRDDLYPQLGAFQEQTGDEAGAISSYEQAYRDQTLDAQGCMRWVTLLMENGATDQARDRIIDLFASQRIGGAQFPQAMDLLRQIAPPEDILLALDDWLGQDPKNAEALYLKGIYLAPTRMAEAVQALEQAGLIDQTLQEDITTLMNTLETAALEEDPARRALLVGRGLVELGEWRAAEAAFAQAVAMQPDLAEGWAFLGEARQTLGKTGDEEIRRALDLAPDSTVVQALAAIYWRRMGQPAVGLVYLHAAANQEPESAYWQVELGKMLCELNNLQDAYKHFLKATELEPENALGWIEMARFSLNYAIKPLQVGLPAARKAVSLAPEDASALDVMGALLFSQNDLASAERFLQQALQKDRTNPDVQLHLGQVYLAAGDLEAARPHLDEAKRLSPETAVGQLAGRLIQQYYSN